MGRRVLLFCILLAAALPVVAAPQALRGFVVDATSGEPLPVANILVDGSRRGATTNLDGFFVLPAMEEGDYLLHVNYLGYYSKEVKVKINGGNEQLRIELAPSSLKLEEITYVVDEVDDEEVRESPRVSTTPIDGATLRQMPSLMAEMDVLRTVQTVPGVKASSEISSALYVRGQSPDATLILMDQSTVYNPSHLFGLFSTFNGDAVKRLELIKGGFPAEYGGRAGSVLQVVTKDGNRQKYEGMFNIGLISARGAIEGPLPNDYGSFAASFRRTYFEPMLSALRSSSDDFDDIPDYFFYDGNAKVNLDLNKSTTLTVGGYLGHDDFYAELGDQDARLELSSYWGNRTTTARLRHVLTPTSFLTASYAYSYYRSGAEVWDLDESGSGDNNLIDDFHNRFRDQSLLIDYEMLGFANHKIKTGIQLNHLKAEVKEENEDITWVDIDTSTVSAAYYVQDQWRIHPLIEIQPGARFYYHEGGDYTTVDPRFSMVYHHSPDMRFKFAAGRYTQFVNLISAGDLLSFYDIWLPYDGTVDPMTINQFVLGFEKDFTDYEFTTEGYYNRMEHLLTFDRSIDEGNDFSDAFLEGDGNAYGVEFMLRKKTGRLTGWLGYSLAWSERRFPFTYLNDGEMFAPKWDRRHDFVAVGMYQLNDKWDLSAQWRYNTGQGYTRAIGWYDSQSGPVPGEFDNPLDSRYGEQNNYRFPEDHRLDVAANYHHKFFGLPAKLTMSVYNVYSRRAIWTKVATTYDDYIEYEDVKLLPVIPLVGYEVRF